MKRKSPALIARAYHAKVKEMLKGKTEKDIHLSLRQGKSTYLRFERMNSSSFDKSWIEVIEDCIFDLGEIIASPKITTKQEGNLVPVELAKKTDAASVQHLSSHTQYIKEVDEYGNVIPSKIMGIFNEDNYLTYENRFIATFVRRLVLFIEKRYEVVAKLAELRNEEILMFKNQSVVNGADVDIETKVKVSYKNDDESSRKSTAYIARIEKIREYILYFYKSPFMRMFKTEKDVRNPIVQTNIIRKNPKYRHCYEVYRFIESYDRLGVNYKVSEQYSDFSEKEMDEITDTLFINYVTLKGKNIAGDIKEELKVYKPKVITSMDDEIFVYGPLVHTPISFVRIDDAYKQYLESKINKDLPEYPTKQERDYYADEYDERRQIKEEIAQLEALQRRKERDNRRFEYNVKLILRQRERARLELEEKLLAAIAKEEANKLAKVRGEIAAASLEHIKEGKQKLSDNLSMVESKYREPELDEIIISDDILKAAKQKKKPETDEELQDNLLESGVKPKRIQYDFDDSEEGEVELDKIPPLEASPFTETIPASAEVLKKLPRKYAKKNADGDMPRRRGRPPKEVSLEDLLATPAKPKGKRGRPRKVVDEMVALTVPKKRGRPPKLKEESNEPKRRGRPPKVESGEKAAPKKRGRPPKQKTEVKIPKKRGRPAKNKEVDTTPKKRGRPRKTEKEQKVPGRRGRPRKITEED
jgi:hypothetical protein